MVTIFRKYYFVCNRNSENETYNIILNCRSKLNPIEQLMLIIPYHKTSFRANMGRKHRKTFACEFLNF